MDEITFPFVHVVAIGAIITFIIAGVVYSLRIIVREAKEEKVLLQEKAKKGQAISTAVTEYMNREDGSSWDIYNPWCISNSQKSLKVCGSGAIYLTTAAAQQDVLLSDGNDAVKEAYTRVREKIMERITNSLATPVRLNGHVPQSFRTIRSRYNAVVEALKTEEPQDLGVILSRQKLMILRDGFAWALGIDLTIKHPVRDICAKMPFDKKEDLT